MKKKLIFPLVLVMVLVLAAPASAAVQLDVNGKNYTAASLDIQAGVTSVPLTVLSHILGCTVTQDGNNIIVQENQNRLQMTVDNKTAWLNEQEVQMSRAPQNINGQIYVPLAFICKSLGADVAWDDAQQLISVAYAETRDGLAAADLLAKSSQQMVEANRYKMAMDMDMNINATVQAEGQSESFNVQGKNASDCWVQLDPVIMYMKQDTTINMPQPTDPGTQNIQIEMLMNAEGMYMNIPPNGWVKMDLPGVNLQDLMNQTQAQNVDAMLQQMKDLGMSVSLANDQEKNGQKYWVIDVVAGNDVFKSDYFKQVLGSIPTAQSADIEKLFDNMDLDLTYSTYVNQETYYTDFMDLQGKIKMNMDVPDETNPGQVAIDMAIKCFYTMSDFGVPFAVPDVSKAVDYSTVME